jgi:Flp pilus assembly protein TadD
LGWRIVTSTRHPFVSRHRRARRAMAVAALGFALCAGGCQNIASLTSAAAVAPQPPPGAKTEAELRSEAESLGARYRAKPDDAATALAYAQALRATGQRTQAVSVLQQASFQHPRDSALLGAFGRALSEVGNYEQALEVLNRAHTPDQPDWRILSAQGAVLDQLGRHDEAQSYYSSALKIKPDDPSAAENGGTDPRVRQNLAVVVGLQGRFSEAESIARAELPGRQRRLSPPDAGEAGGLQDGPASAHARLRRRHLSRRHCGSAGRRPGDQIAVLVALHGAPRPSRCARPRRLPRAGRPGESCECSRVGLGPKHVPRCRAT